MKHSEHDHGRRRFLRLAGIGVAAVPLAGAALRSAPAAADQPRLSEDDPTAQALGYVHDAADVDRDRFPRFEEGQLCANCNLITGDKEAEWVGCGIFPGKLVNANGWCSAWVPKR